MDTRGRLKSCLANIYPTSSLYAPWGELIPVTSPLNSQVPKEMLTPVPAPGQTRVIQDPLKTKGLSLVDVLPLFTRFVSLSRKKGPGS